MIKIVVDVNIWVSFTIGKQLERLKNLAFNNDIQIYSCRELIDEFKHVVNRPKFKQLPAKRIKQTFDLIENVCIKVSLTSDITGSRDKKDNYLLSLCFDCNADYLVTGDNDLLSLKQSNNTIIISFSDFCNIVKI